METKAPFKPTDELREVVAAGSHLVVAVDTIRKQYNYDDIQIAALLRIHADFYEKRGAQEG
jgi:hypothetical protein